MRSNCWRSGRHRTFPGPIGIGPLITNALDTRQEFVRADYNASANWSVTGRYLHERVDSRGEDMHRPGPRARSSLSGRAISPSWRRAGSEDGFLHESSYQLSSHELSRKELVHTRGRPRDCDSGVLS